MGRKYVSDSGKGKSDVKKSPWLYDTKPVYAVCLLNSEDRSLDEQYLRQDAVLYDVENERVFSDAIRVIVINLPMLNPGKFGISDRYYENLLLLMHQISTNMSTVEELLAEIESTTFPEEMKTIFRRPCQRFGAAFAKRNEWRRGVSPASAGQPWPGLFAEKTERPKGCRGLGWNPVEIEGPAAKPWEAPKETIPVRCIPLQGGRKI